MRNTVPDEVIIRGAQGYVIMVAATPGTLLLLLAGTASAADPIEGRWLGLVGTPLDARETSTRGRLLSALRLGNARATRSCSGAQAPAVAAAT